MAKENEVRNIYQKLLEVRKAVPKLTKNNEGFQYKYVSSSQTLEALREIMGEQGLLLVPSVIDYHVVPHEYIDSNGKKHNDFFTELAMKFTWLNVDNPGEKIECAWYGQGLDTGERGVGKALTYAEKYFLLKFFNIATDSDDPDANQKKHDQPKPEPKHEQKPEPQKKIDPEKLTGDATDSQINYLHGLVKSKIMDEEEAYLIESKIERHKEGEEKISKAKASELIEKLKKYENTKGKEQ